MDKPDYWPAAWSEPQDMKDHLLSLGYTEEDAEDFLTSLDQVLRGEGVRLRRPRKKEESDG